MLSGGRILLTIDERIERLEHVTAGWIEQSKKELDEGRRLWREQRDEVTALWQATDRRFEESRRQFDDMNRESHEQMAAIRNEIAERDRVTDKRIADLVSAIGEFIRKQN